MVDKGIYTGSDPSSLTTQQLLREVANLKELLTQRIDDIDKAVQVAHQDLVRVPTEVQESVGNLKEVLLEKFINVEQRFVLTEQIRNEQNHSNAIAISKNEASTSKQIDQLSQQLGLITKTLDDKISDIKERVTAGSSTLLGKNLGTKDSMGWILFAIAIIGFIISNFLKNK